MRRGFSRRRISRRGYRRPLRGRNSKIDVANILKVLVIIVLIPVVLFILMNAIKIGVVITGAMLGVLLGPIAFLAIIGAIIFAIVHFTSRNKYRRR